MKFAPKSEKELSNAFVWEKGVYAFEVVEATDEISKNSGKEMIKLKVKIFKDTGASQNVFDYLLPDTMEYKLRHLCEVTGLLSSYETGSLDAYNLVGKTGWCKVGVSKDKSGQYPDKNSIVDYVERGVPVTLDAALNDDSVPF